MLHCGSIERDMKPKDPAQPPPRTAVVLLSGGQDSTTCLYWALASGVRRVHCVCTWYGQKHSVEMDAAKAVVELARQHYPDAEITVEDIEIGPVLKGSSPLLRGGDELGQYENVADLPGGVEPTFVYGRNLMFLVLAFNRLARILPSGEEGCVITGVCEEDFGGYFDCRRDFIDAMELAIGEGFAGVGSWAKILTPLMYLNKKETVQLAQDLHGCMEAIGYTHTCYAGQVPPCGKCHACHLRARGFEEAGIPDPLVERVGYET